MKVDKKTAAICQTLLAIELYFEERDEISIHTLCSAAYNIFRDLAEKGILKPVLLKQGALQYVDPKHHKDWLSHMNKFENFFKHADRDHDQEIDFPPFASEFVLLENCHKIIEIEGDDYPVVSTYISWFMVKHYDGVLSVFAKDSMTPEIKAIVEDYKKLSPQEFFKRFYPLMERGHHERATA